MSVMGGGAEAFFPLLIPRTQEMNILNVFLSNCPPKRALSFLRSPAAHRKVHRSTSLPELNIIILSGRQRGLKVLVLDTIFRTCFFLP